MKKENDFEQLFGPKKVTKFFYIQQKPALQCGP